MSEDGEEYVYAGHVMLSDESCGWRLVKPENPDDEDKSIRVSGRGSPDYFIGEIVVVEMMDDGRFRHEGTGEKIEDEELYDRLRAESKMYYQRYQQVLNRRRLGKEGKDIEDMTIKELKEYADKGYFNKSEIVQYLLERI